VVKKADEESLTEAYGVFKDEAQQVEPNYLPKQCRWLESHRKELVKLISYGVYYSLLFSCFSKFKTKVN